MKRVYFTNPTWETDCPRIKDGVIGDGYPEIQWVESIWQVADKIDLAIFPDIGLAFEQQTLIKMGVKVWGSRHADGLEARRGLFLDTIKDAGLPVPKYRKIKGLTNLRLFLKDNPDKYIKVSTWRGDFETSHFRSMDEDGGLLDGYAITLGPIQEFFTFYVFDPIDSNIEDGCDSHFAGKWPSVVVHGMEAKDKAFLGTFCQFDELPEPVGKANELIGPVLQKYNYRGSFSTEVRITDDDVGYFIDATARSGSPPSQVQCEMIANYGDIVWYGANGTCVDPEPADKFGVQAMFSIDRSEWACLKIPASIQQHVRVGFSCMVNGMVCVPPECPGKTESGWLCATGSTIEYAIHNLKQYAEEMPDGVDVQIGALSKLLEEAKEAGEKGYTFTNQEIPEPSEVLT